MLFSTNITLCRVLPNITAKNIRSKWIRAAAWHILYPRPRYGDSDLRLRRSGAEGVERRLFSGEASFLRKIPSRCRAYEQELHLYFLLYDLFLVRSILWKL